MAFVGLKLLLRRQSSDPRQFLILVSSSTGDPFNANAPGCYGVEGVVNNPDPAMAATAIRLGNVNTTAAAPWATLPQWALDRTAVIHHRTYQNSHSQYARVLRLTDSAKGIEGNGIENIASVYSYENSESLGTVQVEPVSLSGGGLTYQGRVIQEIQPRTLASMFSPSEGLELSLENLRREKLNQMMTIARRGNSSVRRAWLDRYVSSLDDIRRLDDQLLERFSNLRSNNAQGQIDAAIIMVLMKLSPVIQLRIPFGGDNHTDNGLTRERDQSVSGMASMKYLFDSLESTGLRDSVTVANLHVFGRTLGKKGTEGRDHNLNHHVMMMTGPSVRPGVYGGIIPVRSDFGAEAIDSATGLANPAGDITTSESLEAVAKTLGRSIGIPTSRLDIRINRGRIIQPIVA